MAERTAATTKLKNHISVVWFTNLRAVLEMPGGTLQEHDTPDGARRAREDVKS